MRLRRVEVRYHHPRRSLPVRCVVLHSTGSEKADEVMQYYCDGSSGTCPHYLVLRDGEVLQLVELDRVAYHVGLPQDRLDWYRAGRAEWTRRLKDGTKLSQAHSGYAEWLVKWPGLESPLELATGEHPNGHSVGVEMLCERGACTEEQYGALGELLVELRNRTFTSTVYGHSDVDPISRSSSKGGSDPGPMFDWTRFPTLQSLPKT